MICLACHGCHALPLWCLPGWGQSPDLSHDRLNSHSPSCHGELEGRQEEYLSMDIVKVVSWICEICHIPSAPSESRKICGFQVGLDPDEHPSSYYHLSIGDASAIVLEEIDDQISFPSRCL